MNYQDKSGRPAICGSSARPSLQTFSVVIHLHPTNIQAPMKVRPRFVHWGQWELDRHSLCSSGAWVLVGRPTINTSVYMYSKSPKCKPSSCELSKIWMSPVCWLLRSTTVLFKVWNCKIKNIVFIFCLFFNVLFMWKVLWTSYDTVLYSWLCYLGT